MSMVEGGVGTTMPADAEVGSSMRGVTGRESVQSGGHGAGAYPLSLTERCAKEMRDGGGTANTASTPCRAYVGDVRGFCSNEGPAEESGIMGRR